CCHFDSHIISTSSYIKRIVYNYPVHIKLKPGRLWRHQSNKVLTDFCSCTRMNVSARSGATVNCLILSIFFSSAREIELLTTSSLMTESWMRWTAGPERTGCVQQA